MINIRQWTKIAGLAWGLLGTPLVGAHGVHLAIEVVGPTCVARATYDGGEPIALADAKVFGPAGKGPHQTAQTDIHGKFAFVPDAPGAWRVTVDDRNGHRASQTVNYAPMAGAPEPTAGEAWPRGGRLLTGVGVILGLFGAFSLWKTRKITESIVRPAARGAEK